MWILGGDILDILYDIDELKIYRGSDIDINDYIHISQPTIGKICDDCGEQNYFNTVHTICSVGADLKWQLHELGIDYTKIEDYELFYSILSRSLNKEKTKILFGDTLDFSKMKAVINKNTQQVVMIQQLEDNSTIQIDKFVYSRIVAVLRKMHKIKRNDEIPGNEFTKQILIEDAREEYESNKNKPYKSFLLPLISTMVNSSGFKQDNKSVFEMGIYAFMDSIGRIPKIKRADLLLTSGYSGFGVDLKKINKDELNMFAEPD